MQTGDKVQATVAKVKGETATVLMVEGRRYTLDMAANRPKAQPVPSRLK